MQIDLYAGANTHRAVAVVVDANNDAITNASVGLTLYEQDGTTKVGGTAWPATLDHVGGGHYEGQISSDAAVEHGKLYVVLLTVTQGGTKGELRYTGVRARYRRP